jgi:hypothetical protein
MLLINPPNILPNGTRINGVEHIYQSTKPTTRVNGSDLVADDIWYKTDDLTWWLWNGVYWVTKQIYTIQSALNVFNSTNVLYFPVSSGSFRILLFESNVTTTISSADANNRWDVSLGYAPLNDSVIQVASLGSITSASLTTLFSTTQYVIDTTEVVSGKTRNCVTVRGTKVGTPNNIVFAINISYRRIAP